MSIAMFDISQIRSFIVVAEELHFGRAALRLNITQPPLSRQIQLLEQSLGLTLFERTSHTVRITPAGRVLLPEAQHILKSCEDLSLKSRRLAAGDAGRLSIGFTAVAGYHFVPQLLRFLRQKLPDIEPDLKEMVSSAQLEALSSGRIDLGLLRPPIDSGTLFATRVQTEELVAAVSVDHPLADHCMISLDDFHSKNLIMYSQHGSSYFYNIVSSLLNRHGIKPNTVNCVTQIHSMLALVSAGVGAAIVPASAQRLHFEGVRFLPFVHRAETPVELYAVWQKSQANTVLEQVLGVIRSLDFTQSKSDCNADTPSLLHVP